MKHIALAEELRRHSAAVKVARDTYFAEQEMQRPRVDLTRVCLVRDCGRTTRSQRQLCKEHR